MFDKNGIVVPNFNQIISFKIDHAMENTCTWHFVLDKAAKSQKKCLKF